VINNRLYISISLIKPLELTVWELTILLVVLLVMLAASIAIAGEPAISG